MINQKINLTMMRINNVKEEVVNIGEDIERMLM
jgi:hypothetical protein